MREQVPDRHRRDLGVAVSDAHPPQVLVHRVFEPHEPFLDELHDADRRHRLGDRADPEDGLRRHGPARREVGEPEAREMDELAALHDADREPGESRVVVGLDRELVDPRPPAHEPEATRPISSSASGFSSEERSPGSVPRARARTARLTIFALRVFGSADTKRIRSGRKAFPSAAETAAPTSRASSSPALQAGLRHAEDPRDLALDVVRHADRRRLCDPRVAERGRLELGGADPLARDVERVVGAPVEVPVAVIVDRRPVAVRPDAGEPPPVRVEVPLRIPQMPRVIPGHGRRQTSSPTSPRTGFPVRSEHVHVQAERRKADRALLDRLGHDHREEAGADLGPAAQVDDRDAPAAHLLGEPAVRRWIPRLAGGREDRQRREICNGVSLGDQGANERRRDPEHVDALVLDRASRDGRRASRARPPRRRRVLRRRRRRPRSTGP